MYRPQKWLFKPYPSPFKGEYAWRLFLIFVLLVGLTWEIELIYVKILAYGLFVWYVWREWRDYQMWRNPAEYIYMDNQYFVFRVYPYSGRLKIDEITEITHLYQEFNDGENRTWDVNVGIIITTPKEIIELDLSRMKQCDESGIYFNHQTNGNVIINEWAKRKKAFQAA